MPVEPSRAARRAIMIWAAALQLLAMMPACAAVQAMTGTKERFEAHYQEDVLSMRGDPADPAVLEVTLFTPPKGNGLYPLVILNHGSSSEPSENGRKGVHIAGLYFLSRGYAVAVPMMRGYGASQGRLRGRPCDFVERGDLAARDIMAVANTLGHRLDIDGSRVVVVGQSLGGWHTLAVGAMNHPTVKGLVNLAGGIGNGSCKTWRDNELSAIPVLGGRSRVPSIWFYGDNDSISPPELWRELHRRYLEAGGIAELVAFGSFMDDAHYLDSKPEGISLLATHLDAFLERIGMPHRLVHAPLMPTAFPAASDYAGLQDETAIPYVGPEARRMYRTFLEKRFPRVFVVAEDGFAMVLRGGLDPAGDALGECEETHRRCHLYAVDDRVVWQRPTRAPRPSRFAKLTDVEAVPYLNAQGRGVYQRYLAQRRPKAFVVAPDGAVGAFSGGEDPLARALTDCARQHTGCALYAVDDDVVWTPGSRP